MKNRTGAALKTYQSLNILVISHYPSGLHYKLFLKCVTTVVLHKCNFPDIFRTELSRDALKQSLVKSRLQEYSTQST